MEVCNTLCTQMHAIFNNGMGMPSSQQHEALESSVSCHKKEGRLNATTFHSLDTCHWLVTSGSIAKVVRDVCNTPGVQVPQYEGYIIWELKLRNHA